MLYYIITNMPGRPNVGWRISKLYKLRKLGRLQEPKVEKKVEKEESKPEEETVEEE